MPKSSPGRGLFVIRGEGFFELGKALKGAANKELRKQLRKDIREAGKPVVVKMRKNARGISGAPKEWKKKAAQRTSLKMNTTKRKAGIRIITTKPPKETPIGRYMNRGKWRHPVFGNRNNWVEQRVNPNWFDAPAKQSHRVMVTKVANALQKVVEQIAREARL